MEKQNGRNAWNELPIGNVELDESKHLKVLISHNETWNLFAQFLKDLMPYPGKAKQRA